MANIKKITHLWNVTALTVYCIIRREADGYLLNDADGAFASGPADPYVSLAEDATIKGMYELSESRSAWDNGKYSIVVYRQTGASPVPASDIIIGGGAMEIKSDAEVVNANVQSQDNIDFGALQKASLSAATPSVTVSDKTGFSLAATGADLILKSSTFIQAIVAAINELPTYGLTALNTLLVTTGIKTALTAAPTDMALNSTVAKDATVATVANQTTIIANQGTINANVLTRSSHSASDVWSVGTRTLTSFGTLVADIATAVWGAAARTLTAISDSAGITTLLSRIGGAIMITGGKVDVNDKTGFSLATTPPTAAQIKTAIEAEGGHLALILEDTGTTIPGTLAAIDAKINVLGAGTGAIKETVTVKSNGVVQAEAEVWITTDAAGAHIIASGVSNSSGDVDFYLDAGTYYAWAQKDGVNFTNPTTITVN